MSAGLVTCAAACLAATVQLYVAPDQPRPHVYVGDPLIIEIESDGNTRAVVNVTIEPDYGAATTEQAWDPVDLRAHATRWLTVDSAPDGRGQYELRARVEHDGLVSETARTFCRVDRPLPGYELPVSVALADDTPHALVALKVISVRCVRWDAGTRDLAARVDEAVAAGCRALVAVAPEDVEACESLARELGERVAGWEVDPGGNAETFAAAAAGLRAGGAHAAIDLVVDRPEAVTNILHAGHGPHIRTLVFRTTWPEQAAVAAVRRAARRAGYEDMPLHVDLRPEPSAGAADGPHLMRQLLTHLAGGVARTGLDPSLILTQEFGPGYVYLSALAHRLHDAVHAGRLDLGPGVQALVFRHGAQWTVAAWALAEPTEAALNLGDATDLALFDARNNPLPVPEVTDGAVALELTDGPVFVTGKGGPVLEQAAQNVVRRRAALFLGAKQLMPQLPSDVANVVGKFAATDGSGYSRLDFFDLLRLFPRLEGLWHSGALPRSAATPALAGLSQLARAVCVLEQERGEPFVEPLQNTLSNCGQFQSVYITSSAGSSATRERPDWILDRVTALMAEAEALAREDRSIEANAVAALAEWRARSLEAAGKAAPLSAPEKPRARQEQGDEQAEPAETDTAEQAAE